MSDMKTMADQTRELNKKVWGRSRKLAQLTGVPATPNNARKFIAANKGKYETLLDRECDKRNPNVRKMITDYLDTLKSTQSGKVSTDRTLQQVTRQVRSPKSDPHDVKLLFQLKDLAIEHRGIKTLEKGIQTLKSLQTLKSTQN